MQVYLAQENPIIGDLQGNVEKLRQVVEANSTADIIVFPELFLTGYPPKDLLLKKDFLRQVEQNLGQIQDISRKYAQAAFILGMPWQGVGGLFNAAVVIKDGVILGVQHKRRLTQFKLFDENQYFQAGTTSIVVKIGERTIGLALGLELDDGLAQELKEAGAGLIINPVAIPFQVGEHGHRRTLLSTVAQNTGIPILRVGQVGGNDGLIFAGGSFTLDKYGKYEAILPDFTCSGALVNLDAPEQELADNVEDETAQIYQALILGLRDYVEKCGMRTIIIGLSGGLDSAVAAVLACQAVGSENVWGITQPGPYSSSGSVDDARSLAENLRIKFDVLPINDLYEATLKTLDGHFAGTTMNVAEENIQARLRGNLLMALSNKFGGLVLTNSNKSELAVGYCTLYGDMSGGLAVIADVYKTMVYQLAYYINREEEIIPWNTIQKPPSAELRPDQRDDETLPPYDILDAIIKAYLDESLSTRDIIEQGYAEDTVRWVTRTIDNNDYKRRQAALILRVTSPIVGRDRQMPLAAKKEY